MRKRGPFTGMLWQHRQPWNPWRDRRFKIKKHQRTGLAGRSAVFKRAYIEAGLQLTLKRNLLSARAAKEGK